ncbi:MAG: drug resistance transporter, EmrB/QacA subfamily [Acidobacteria bacterium]|nr:drug resistance transporter, EmrB/QacA subfamily [Acidobacteriota bacterium]
MAQELLREDTGIARRQVLLGLFAVFAVYGTMYFFVQTTNIARPRMAADLDGMSLYSYSISIPGLAAAFVTLIFGKFSDMYGRRIMLLVSLVFFLAGTVLSAISPTFPFLIAANSVARVGSSAVMMLSFSVLGDMFPPAERSKWVGLLNIPAGIFALVGPTLGGWFVDNLSWRHLYWMAAPLLVLCLLVVMFGVPAPAGRQAHKIDLRGCLLVAVASSATILGLSFAGSTYAWTSVQVICLLSVAVFFWILFFRVEAAAEEPILDPQVLKNRTFFTVAIATLLSFFGQIGMTMYFPMFLQGVQSMSATKSGMIVTPFTFLMASVGIPAGLLLARTKRYKKIYIFSFALLTADMFAIIFFTAETPTAWGLIAALFAGLGLGSVPTVNTIVVQNAVSRRLLGVVMGAIFFCISMGGALSPAVLGSAMNAVYERKLAASLPEKLKQVADEATMQSLGNSRVLLSAPAMAKLEKTFSDMGSDGPALFRQTVQAIRVSMEAGLRSVFLVAAVAMLLAFILICTVPEIPLGTAASDKKAADSTAVAASAATLSFERRGSLWRAVLAKYFFLTCGIRGFCGPIFMNGQRSAASPR